MGRPSKPIEIHKIQGTLRKQRHGRRKGELDPEDRSLPDPPEWLGIDGKTEWARLLSDSKYLAALRSADFTQLVIYCQMWSRFCESERAGKPMNAKYLSTMSSIGSKFGLTPSDRAKVRVVEEEKKPSGWAVFRSPRTD